jgi:hypothetical protein
MQYGLSTLLIVVTVAAIICSLAKVAASYYPAGFFWSAAGVAALTIPISAAASTLIGKRIGRIFESIYLGVIWGFVFAALLCIPDIVGQFVPFYASSTTSVVLKAATGGALGGWFGGVAMWWIAASQSSGADDDSEAK